MFTLNTLAIGVGSLFAVVAAEHGQILPRSHHYGVVERSEHHQKRGFSGQGTYYLTGLGACGINNSPSDKIVALNSAQYGGGYPGPHCFKSITICALNECHGAQITDECPTCDYGSLDMSESLFQQFASTDLGVIPITWTFNDGSADPTTTTTQKPDPTTTTHTPDPPKTTSKEPEPTTSKEQPTTTSKRHTSTKPETTSTPEPTTSTSTSTSSEATTTSTFEAKSSATSTSTSISTSTSTSELSTTAVATSVTPTATADPDSSSGTGSSGSNWVDMNQVMLAMGKLLTIANNGA